MKDMSVKDGKIVYSGRDKKIQERIKTINRLGGFPVRKGTTSPKKYTDEWEIIAVTTKNLDILHDYI